MAPVKVAIETSSRRVFASALDWPGWCRSGKDEALALQALEAYATRYARVAALAGESLPRRGVTFDVAERLPGSPATSFGVPEAVASIERRPMTASGLERMCALVEACWKDFDGVAKRAPAVLRKGPRGGGRDRDKIVEHVVGAEAGAYAPKLGLKLKQPAIDDRAGIAANRKALIEALRAGRDGKPLRERGWPVRYAARRIAWHVLDHAWEMEDRSESG